MILYCDTSALVKRYVREPHSDTVRQHWRAAGRVATAEVAFAEAVAAFARRARAGDLSAGAHERVRSRLSADFRRLVRIPVSDELNRRIAELVLRYPLRGFDAIHLAAALLLRDEIRTPIAFACFDAGLLAAAKGEGLAVPADP